MEYQVKQHTQLNYYQYKRNVFFAAAAFSLLLGAFTAFYENTAQSRVLDIVSIVGFGVLMLGWCTYDSFERNKSLGSTFRLLVVIFGVFTLFVYLLKSRGLKKGLIAIGWSLLLMLGISLLMVLSETLFGEIFGV